ncbi:MFS transporter [Calothrix rhizosoleniae]|uniref:MFS transporter n=1 Tax=Calothrix rhizosoleniae TaxID=888997 RepID=UPI000B4A37EE|nr:MFS transporter [Calothrix rhizosoleniae]
MELKKPWLFSDRSFIRQILQWINLREEESERTLLLFIAYTAICVGLRWAERSTEAQLVYQSGVDYLPRFYIASAVIGSGLVFFYSWLQRVFPLRSLLVALAPIMVLPLFILPVMMQIPGHQGSSLFILRLWLDAIYIVNELNTSIAANQLFDIRQIKRTYPLIRSGFLVAQVFSGFSLYWLLDILSLNYIVFVTGLLIVFGGSILLYLSNIYPQAFPNTRQQKIKGSRNQLSLAQQRHISQPVKQYAWLLIALIALLQVIGMLIEFQYFSQVESKFQGNGGAQIAKFLGVLDGIVGLCALITQWFISSRAVENLGAFFTISILPAGMALLPGVIAFLGLFFMSPDSPIGAMVAQNFFWGLVFFQFFDDLFRYTFIANNNTLFFHPIPDKIRSYLQTLSEGVAGAAGAFLASTIILTSPWLADYVLPYISKNWILVIETAAIGIICFTLVWFVRSRYVELLVLSAGKGHLSTTDVDIKALKQAVIKGLLEKGKDADKHSCIELLSQIDLQTAKAVLAPLLINLPASLQYQSLEVMLTAGVDPQYSPSVRALLDQPQGFVVPEVFALALRYVWLAEENSNLQQLTEYLHQEQDSLIRGTAATLLLRQGDAKQRVAATKTLGQLLTHKQEKVRVNAVKILNETAYLQTLRIHIPNLLQDESLRVRCAVLEMIARTRLEEYYHVLIAGLCYKSTRTQAIKSIVTLENETLPMLIKLGTNIYQPEIVRMYAWRTISQISTPEVINSLWLHLEKSCGKNRNYILQALLKRYQQEGILGLANRWHQIRVEQLIEEELRFLGEIYAAYTDLKFHEIWQTTTSERLTACQLLLKALLELEIDIKERLLLLLKLIYNREKIQAATFHVRSEFGADIAQGLEILEHTIHNLKYKPVLLHIFDHRPLEEKLKYINQENIVEYEPMVVSDRISSLLTHSHYLSDWCLACCFHLSKVAKIKLSIPTILDNLRHPTGFVREAALAYVAIATRNVLDKILPQMKKDRDPLVAALVQELIDSSQINCEKIHNL